MTKGFTLRLIPALMMFGFASVAGASGFALQNQTGSGNGTAFAGAAASAEDAGTIYFNPAGMTYLPQGHNIAVAGTLLNRSIEFRNTNSAQGTLAWGSTNGGNAGGLSLIPAGYYAYSISPSLRVGVGVSPTFGNKTEYTPDFLGRNSAISTKWEQTNINPSIAYKLNDKVSVAAGLNYALLHLHLRQGVASSSTQLADISASADGWGYNLGLMWQISPSTRLGLAYRSTIEFNATDGRNRNPVTSYDFTAKVKTPDNFSMALSQQLSDRWEMLGDVTWTGWSSIQNLDLISKSTGNVAARLSYNFRDTWRVGLGANYKYNDQWKFRFGTAYDRSPVKTPEDRTMTLPDSDRIWLSFGAKYQLSKVSSVDFGYTHIFFRAASTNRNVTTGAGTATTQFIRGDFDASADLLSVQYNHTF